MFSVSSLNTNVARELGEALIDAAQEIELLTSNGTRENYRVEIERFGDAFVALPVEMSSDDPVITVTS